VTREAAIIWSSLGILTKRRADALVAKYGSLDDAVGHIDEETLRGLGCREETTREMLLKLSSLDLDHIMRRLASESITLLTLDDAEYPERLRQTADPPVFLYAKGAIACMAEPSVAIVGTRRMTPYGARVTQVFTEGIVRTGLVTVSGLADGVDTEVAKETLRAGGTTVAVLGQGFDTLSPQRRVALGMQIVRSGGLLLSELPLDHGPAPHTFPARNRIIAGLSLGTLVTEAPTDSGALITAQFALDEGRDVFAVPGNVFEESSAGCHRIIGAGQAKLVTHPDEILRELGVVTSSAPSFAAEAANNEERLLLEALTVIAQTAEELAQKSTLALPRVSATLTFLELRGLARNTGGGMWVRG
jgi:DNA processing protein